MGDSSLDSIPTLKTCFKCGVEKALGEFCKDKLCKDGHHTICKECRRNKNDELHKKNRERKVVQVPIDKKCPVCFEVKSATLFIKNKSSKDGLGSRCRDCYLKFAAERRAKNELRAFVNIPERKTCSNCKIEKLKNQFRVIKAEKDGLFGWCRDCQYEAHLKFKFGVDSKWIEEKLKAQGGACAICGRKDPGERIQKFCVDHDHVTKKLRGLLCDRCNLGLGSFRDSVDFIDRAKEYLGSSVFGIKYKKKLNKVTKNEILLGQKSLCKICFVDLSIKRACLDHCHNTKMIRGYLCNGCNSGLGKFKDSTELLQRAIEYLEKYKVEVFPCE